MTRFRLSGFTWIFAVLSALLLFAPLRRGDLAGYDDALYAHIAKGVVLSGDWLNLTSNGLPVLEHPPLLVWSQAALFSLFGFHDALAKLPAALAGWGTILLVYCFARRLLRDEWQATLAMFVMATSIYFLKYSSRAMTDVPCTFLFLASMYAWIRADEDSRWYIVTGILAAMAQMSRGMIGLALPLIFALDLWARRKRPPLVPSIAGLVITFLPISAWYAYTITAHPAEFFTFSFFRNAVYGELSPAWRRYTGAPEYLWMITKSYWPWLPALVAGLAVVIRSRDLRLGLLPIWAGVVFLLCAITRSRVLRYMLPAYPAFAVLAAIGLSYYVKRRWLLYGLRVLTPLLAIGIIWIALFPPVIWHAAEIRPIAAAETAATPPGERVTFFDEGNPRFDETNQLQWYGGRNLLILFTPIELAGEIEAPRTHTFILDRKAFKAYVQSKAAYEMLAESGNLVCFKLRSYQK